MNKHHISLNNRSIRIVFPEIRITSAVYENMQIRHIRTCIHLNSQSYVYR